MFLHGYLADKNSFIYQKDFLKEYFNIHLIDLTGFGENAFMPYPYSLTDYANEVKEYIKKNNLKSPHIVAHSFGARIVMRLASENQNLFDKIVLTGAAGLKPKFSFKKFCKKSVFKLLKPFVKKEKLKKFYSSDYNSLPAVMKKSFILIVNEHLDDKLEYINNKTLIIFGKNDKDTPVYFAKRLQKGIKNSKLVLLENAGHFAFIDQALKFNLEVREFLLS